MTATKSPTNGANLHNISLTRKEDWSRFVNAPRRVKPDLLSPEALAALSSRAARDYDKRRRDWHANIGVFKTPQFKALHDQLWTIVDSNQQDGDKAKGAVAVDAPAGLGKTTTVQHFAKDFQLRVIAEESKRTRDGHERVPVCWVSLTGNPTMRDVNRSMLDFFAHPGSTNGTATQFIRRALDCVLSCETKLLVIDDLHFLRWPSANSIEVSNHFKFIANAFPVTVVFIGVGLARGGLLDEGKRFLDGAKRPPNDGNRNDHEILAQTLRRTTVLNMTRYHVTNPNARRQWRSLLLTIEQRLVLARGGEGMLADALANYLWGRTKGHIGSLMTLINRGCLRAIRSGAEELTKDLLDGVKLDAAAEAARGAEEAALRAGEITARLHNIADPNDANPPDPR